MICSTKGQSVGAPSSIQPTRRCTWLCNAMNRTTSPSLLIVQQAASGPAAATGAQSPEPQTLPERANMAPVCFGSSPKSQVAAYLHCLILLFCTSAESVTCIDFCRESNILITCSTSTVEEGAYSASIAARCQECSCTVFLARPIHQQSSARPA